MLASPEFRERLKRLRLAAERVGGSGERGARQSRSLGAGLEFAGHRPYSPGDDVRYLDWNALGRLDTLVLKQFEAPGELTVAVAPDTSATMRFGEPEKLAAALELETLVLWGNSGEAVWRPLGRGVHILRDPGRLAAMPVQTVLENLRCLLNLAD